MDNETLAKEQSAGAAGIANTPKTQSDLSILIDKINGLNGRLDRINHRLSSRNIKLYGPVSTEVSATDDTQKNPELPIIVTLHNKIGYSHGICDELEAELERGSQLVD